VLHGESFLFIRMRGVEEEEEEEEVEGEEEERVVF
jgi:hypothetical protein